MREEKKGPRVDAPEAAINGFVKSAGLASIAEAERREDKKGAFYVALIEKRGRPAAEVVAEIVPEIVANFPWPKSMRWGSGKLRWVRPLHSILCLLDGKVVPFEVDGIRSGKETRGHRFMAPKPFVVKGFADYVKKLRAAKVILDGGERAKLILDGARILAKKEKLALVEDRGTAPGECRADRMARAADRRLRRGISVGAVGGARDRDEGASEMLLAAKGREARQPLHHGGESEGEGRRRGDRRRQRARNQGKACRRQVLLRSGPQDVLPEERVPKLDGIIFHEKLGSQYQRVQRVWKLAREVAPRVGADPDLAERAAILAKADLVSCMVGEFPELQGVMGRYYALDQEENPAVADAIAAHYKPLGPSDEVPREPVAIAVALADKLDALMGFWAIDEKPTGSKDPYALRRAALGVIRIVLENGVRLPLMQQFRSDARSVAKLREDAATNLLAFFADRLKVHLREQGARHDLVDAVFALGGDDLLMIVRRVDALGRFLDTEDGEHLLTGTKRAINILRIEEKKDGVDLRPSARRRSPQASRGTSTSQGRR